MYMPTDRAHYLNSLTRFIRVNVFRPVSTIYEGSTNGGITSEVEELYVPHPQGPHNGLDIHDRLKLLVLPSAFNDCPARFRPLIIPKGTHSMAGGNWVYSGDSRFSELYGHAPVSVHDRVE